MKQLILSGFDMLGYQLQKKGRQKKVQSRLSELIKENERLEGLLSSTKRGASVKVKRELDYYKKMYKRGFGRPNRIDVREPFASLKTANAAMQKLIDDFSFSTVLDVGAGSHSHAYIFEDFGKVVTTVDFGVSIYHQRDEVKESSGIRRLVGDFNTLQFDSTYDCIWASHVLEHQSNTKASLEKLVSLCNEGGLLAITVPPLKHPIVSGHVSLWNGGLLLYRLVEAGLDCSSASLLSYGYNISVIVRKKSIDLPSLEYDAGDLKKIRRFLPDELDFVDHGFDVSFNGDIERVNW